MNNFILKSDAYKHTHHIQYPKDTEYIYSYYESRGGFFNRTVFFGLQMILKKHFEGIIVTKEMVDEAESVCLEVFGQDYFNRKGWDIIVNDHGGRLPIEIKAVPEGMVINKNNVLMTVVNTDPRVPFITNFVETILTQIWYPISVATNSYQIKEIIQYWANKTGGSVSPFHLNDFGFRGSSSYESSAIGGLAHLTQFLGTDTLSAIVAGKKYYNAGAVGHSVFATEHSTTTIYGKDNEKAAIAGFLDKAPDGAIVSIVSDSYDIYKLLEFYGTELKERILSRAGKFVVRPDSGDQIKMSLQVVQSLWKNFGGTVNEKGYKVLNPKVGVIYGDGIDKDTIGFILEELEYNNFCSDCIIFGSGGGLLQKVDRDTHRFAFKCCAACVDGKWINVYKEPVTDSGKRSKKGKLKLVKTELAQGTYYDTLSFYSAETDVMEVVFRDGQLLQECTLDEVRQRSL